MFYRCKESSELTKNNFKNRQQNAEFELFYKCKAGKVNNKRNGEKYFRIQKESRNSVVIIKKKNIESDLLSQED